MKKANFLVVMLLISGLLSINAFNLNAQKKTPKVLTEMQDKANKMIKKGAIAVVGIAVADAGRVDIGKRKAIALANQLIAEANRVKVEATTHSFMEEIGVGQSAQQNDVFNNMIDMITSNLNKGGMVDQFKQYQTKANKKDGTATYVVLYYVSPKTLYENLEKTIKNSEESLYQQFRDSEVKKEHEKKIKAFEEEFGFDKD